MDEKLQIFNRLLLECYDRHAPMQRVHFKHMPAPWLTAEIKKLMTRRDCVRRAWRRSGDHNTFATYKSLRNTVQNLVRAAKAEYYNSVLDRTNNAVETWDKLRHLGLVEVNANKSIVHTPLRGGAQ